MNCCKALLCSSLQNEGVAGESTDCRNSYLIHRAQDIVDVFQSEAPCKGSRG